MTLRFIKNSKLSDEFLLDGYLFQRRQPKPNQQYYGDVANIELNVMNAFGNVFIGIIIRGYFFHFVYEEKPIVKEWCKKSSIGIRPTKNDEINGRIKKYSLHEDFDKCYYISMRYGLQHIQNQSQYGIILKLWARALITT
jgi:hypothetical protein